MARPELSAQPLALSYVLHGVSTRYDFRIELNEVTQARPTMVFGKARATISISHKEAATPFQRVSIDMLDERVAAPDYQRRTLVGDFDFDGKEDFAFQDGHNGSYGSPSYSVFLYRDRYKQFVRSVALSNLTEQSMGFPEVDPGRRRLRTYSKSGCCIHWTSEYDVIGGIPRRMKTETEETTIDDRCFQRIEERRPDGTWSRSEHPCAGGPADSDASP